MSLGKLFFASQLICLFVFRVHKTLGSWVPGSWGRFKKVRILLRGTCYGFCYLIFISKQNLYLTFGLLVLASKPKFFFKFLFLALMSRSRNYSVSNAVFKVLVDPGRLFNLSVKWFFLWFCISLIFIRSCRSWCLCYSLWFILWLFSWKIDVFAIFCDEVPSLPPIRK